MDRAVGHNIRSAANYLQVRRKGKAGARAREPKNKASDGEREETVGERLSFLSLSLSLSRSLFRFWPLFPCFIPSVFGCLFLSPIAVHLLGESS
jgi:hypothetical protein